METYTDLREYASLLDIRKGDTVLITSDAKVLLWDAVSHGARPDPDALIDGLIEAVGPEGTVIFPTYNWAFCKGVAFDYRKTPCKTGTLGTAALRRSDFRRTAHPIYSFAVHGKDQDLLCGMRNTSSFGADSPFMFFKERHTRNYIFDVSLQHSFTFVHFVEEQSGAVRYRYLKPFTAGYVDGSGREEERTYSMFVRDLDLDVVNTIDPMEEVFLEHGAARRYAIGRSKILMVDLGKAYDLILEDILENDSRRLCTFKGQKSAERSGAI